MTAPSAPPLDRVVETALYANDLARSRSFYVDMLGCGVLLDSARLLGLSVGGVSVLLIFQRGATNDPLPTPGGVVPPHGGTGIQHIAFAVPDRQALDKWAAHVKQHGVEIESRVRWPRGGESVYIRDPDGHSIEFITPGLWAIY